MRGAKNTQSGGLKYLSFMSGKFVQRVDENTTGATPRVLEKGKNSGQTVHELHYDTYEGQIYKMQTEASEYGTRLHVFIDVSTPEEPDSKVKLSLPFSSGPAKGLLSRLPKLVLSKDVELKGYYIKNDNTGRYNAYLVPYQDGQKITPFYTKDEPNGLPQMKKIKVKGQDVWDDTEQLEFYQELINSTNWPGEPGVKAVEPEDFKDEPVEPQQEEQINPVKGGKLPF